MAQAATKDQPPPRMHRRARSLRRLQHPIVRLAREKANALIAEGKTVKIIGVGKKGYDQPSQHIEKQIIDLLDLRGPHARLFPMRSTYRPQGARFLRGGRMSTFVRCFTRASIGDSRKFRPPKKLIPPEFEKANEDAPLTRNEPEEGEIMEQFALPRAVAVRIYPPCIETMASFYGSQMSAWTMRRATRAT